MPTNRISYDHLLNPSEKEILENAYLEIGVAIDQLKRDMASLDRLHRIFMTFTGRQDIDKDLLIRYMLNRRKQQLWVRLGSSAQRFASAVKSVGSGLSALVSTYVDAGVPLDHYLSSPALVRDLATKYKLMTRDDQLAYTLVAALMSLRKRGVLPTIENAAFSDIREIA